MKNSKKMFLRLEASLAFFVVLLALIMIQEQRGKVRHKISVILQDSDAMQWSSFRYGLKMAAKDQDVELVIASIGKMQTVEEEINAMEEEISRGADAVIVQPVPGIDSEGMIKSAGGGIPIMLVGHIASKGRESSKLPVTEPDHYAMGKALAEEMLVDYNGKIEGKTVGIVSTYANSQAVLERKQGMEKVLKESDARIRWSVSVQDGESEENDLDQQPKVDLVLALDDTALTVAGEYVAENNFHGALVYGIAHSTEAMYYLDTGMVECLVVPDEFKEGYQALTEVSECLTHFYRKMKDQTLSYSVIRREELFSKENQEILFTMSQ